MDIVMGDLLTVEGKKYITLETLTYENDKYAFVNKVIDEETVSDEYYIFKIINDEIVIVTEEELQKILLPKFQKLLEKDINNILQD